MGVQVQPDVRSTHGEGNIFHDLDPNNKWNCLFRRKCVIQMKNSDNLCVLRSFVILRSKFAGDGQYKNLIHPHKSDFMGTFGLKRNAIDLQRQAGLGDNQPVLFQDLWQFENVLDAQILVVDGTEAFDIVYPGSKERDKKLFLFKANNNCHPIMNLGAFFNKGVLCKLFSAL